MKGEGFPQASPEVIEERRREHDLGRARIQLDQIDVNLDSVQDQVNAIFDKDNFGGAMHSAPETVFADIGKMISKKRFKDGVHGASFIAEANVLIRKITGARNAAIQTLESTAYWIKNTEEKLQKHNDEKSELLLSSLQNFRHKHDRLKRKVDSFEEGLDFVSKKYERVLAEAEGKEPPHEVKEVPAPEEKAA
jgi:hypothetical protein